MGEEYGRDEQLYVIRKNLGVSQGQFDQLEEEEVEEMLELELWQKDNFAVWKEESQLVSLEKWLVLLCLLPSFLSLLLLLPFFVQPVSPGPQALIFGQPLYLIWAGLDLVTTALGSSQLVVSKKLVKSWQENEKKLK